MKKRYADKNNVLLVNITRLGDMLQATPTIAGIKLENPNAKITVLVEKQFEEVCHFLPHIDEIVSIDLGMTVRCLAREQEGILDAFDYLSEVVDDLKSRNFDYCLNMSSSAYTALLIKLVGIERSGGWTADEEGYRVIESDWAKLFATSVFPHNREFNSLNLVDVFRCSADVEQHPQRLLIKMRDEDLAYADQLIADAKFTNKGPLVALQAGASQEKRQWAPEHFVKLCKLLTEKYDARVILTGSGKELKIIDPIFQACNSPNVVVTAGKTSIPQLGAMLERCDILVTGDTGPMHMAVAVGTPVVSMFLASAYGYETGPYSEGNIVIQPIIGCGPCNPNKPCSQTDCHDQLDPEIIAELTMLRLKGDVKELPAQLAASRGAIIYRTRFDQFGFYHMQPLTHGVLDPKRSVREAYRKVWLDDLAGYQVEAGGGKSLGIVNGGLEGVNEVVDYAEHGRRLIQQLAALIEDVHSPFQELGKVNNELSELDRAIEQKGFHYPALGPVTRMFVFAKENLSGTDPISLASQMGRVYDDLARRSRKLAYYYQAVS